jgi:hypothetical protein
MGMETRLDDDLEKVSPEGLYEEGLSITPRDETSTLEEIIIANEEPTDGGGMSAVEPILTGREDEDAQAQASDLWVDEEENSPIGSVPLPPLNIPAVDKMLDLLVTDEAIKELWKRAEDTRKKINHQINNVNLATALMDRIMQARNYLMAGKENYEEAARLIHEVEHRLEFAERVAIASRKVAPRLLVYEVLWLIALASGIGLSFTVPDMGFIPMGDQLGQVSIAQFVSAILWGGLGGVVGTMYALWQHVAADQDFDSQYAIWYITNPILGVVMGAVIFWIIQAGFFSLTAGGESQVNIRSASVIYILAWVAGYKQNVVYEIVRRILDVFRVEPSSKDETTAGG